MDVLTDRYGDATTFPLLMGFCALPLLAIAAWHSALITLVVFGFLLGFAGASFAVGVPYVSRWFPKERQGFALGVYGVGMGGTVLTALTSPTIAQTWGLSAPFVLGAVLVTVFGLVFWALSEKPPSPRRGATRLTTPFR